MPDTYPTAARPLPERSTDDRSATDRSAAGRSTDDPALADCALADRVAAIERALTDERVGVDAATAGSAVTAAGTVATPPTGRDRRAVDPARVEALESDLADLRAAVDALRGVVGELDARAGGDGGGRDAPESRDTPPSPDTDRSVAARSGPDGDRESLDALRAPTGRPIRVGDPSTHAPGPLGDEPGRRDADADAASGDETRAGILARVTDVL